MKKPAIPAGVIVMLAASALAIEPPAMKEGLWSVHTTSIDNPGNVKSEGTYKLCRNHAYDQYAHGLASNAHGCKITIESVAGGVYRVQTECNIAGSVIKSESTTTLHGDTASRSESHGTYTPAIHGVSEINVVMEQNYLGSCPAGVQPGDRINQNGTTMHLWRH